MNRKGLTLIELLTVIAIMTILMAIAGMFYSTWSNKYRLEGQVRELSADLMNARVQAMQKNRVYFVKVEANRYSLTEDTNDTGGNVADTGDTTLWTKSFKFNSNWINTAAMNTRGLVSPSGSLTFVTNGVSAAYDCIELSPTRIIMGKWNGTACVY